jgi:hypothetical protein
MSLGRSRSVPGLAFLQQKSPLALAKQPPDAAANYHHEQNRHCDCAYERCNHCCERKDVQSAILKCEKHVSDGPLRRSPDHHFWPGPLVGRLFEPCGGERSVSSLCFSLRRLPLSRSDCCGGFVRSCQSVVRWCRASNEKALAGNG